MRSQWSPSVSLFGYYNFSIPIKLITNYLGSFWQSQLLGSFWNTSLCVILIPENRGRSQISHRPYYPRVTLLYGFYTKNFMKILNSHLSVIVFLSLNSDSHSISSVLVRVNKGFFRRKRYWWSHLPCDYLYLF